MKSTYFSNFAMLPYSIDELVDDRNRELYDQVAAVMRIELDDSEDEYWGARSENGVGYISVAPSDSPISCFTHELLHLWFDSKGKSRPNAFWNPEFPNISQQTESFVANLVPYAYNQLMHLIMYTHFVRMGFPPNEFLTEINLNDDYRRIESDLKLLKSQSTNFPHGLPAGMIAYPFLMLKNPHDTSQKLQTLTKKLRTIAGQSYYDLNKLVTKWTTDCDSPPLSDSGGGVNYAARTGAYTASN
jgi:hypothetical protein